MQRRLNIEIHKIHKMNEIHLPTSKSTTLRPIRNPLSKRQNQQD